VVLVEIEERKLDHIRLPQMRRLAKCKLRGYTLFVKEVCGFD
jgi:hypothetical protein